MTHRSESFLRELALVCCTLGSAMLSNVFVCLSLGLWLQRLVSVPLRLRLSGDAGDL